MITFVSALSYPLRAFGLLVRTPSLWRYVVVPIGVSLLLGAALYAALLWAGFRGLDGLMAQLPDWATPAGALIRIALLVALFIVIAYLLVRFGVILGSPWYSHLSEQIEIMRTGSAPASEVEGVAGALGEIGRTLLFELRKLLLVVTCSLILLLIDLIPGPGTVIAAAGGIALGAFVACLDFLGPSLDRRRLGLRRQIGVVVRGLPGTAGLGLVCLGLVSIPFLNLLLIPVCVAAGALYHADYLRPEIGSGGKVPNAPK